MKISHTSLCLLAFVTGLLLSCSPPTPVADEPYLVRAHRQPLAGSRTPENFAVSIGEIDSLIPLTRYGWNVYADSQNYYLSSSTLNHFVKENSVTISGKTRDDIIKLHEANSETDRMFFTPKTLRAALQ